ncbi:hypothetical protein GX48_03517 [Paracoccidioides brasiliensis]|nr:hypothetical protein GX48_03517 [Paracoccidioides brasiliensis]
MKCIPLQAPRRVRGSVCQLCQFSKSIPHRERAAVHIQSTGVSTRFNTLLPNAGHQKRSFRSVFNLHNGISRRFASGGTYAKPHGDPEAMLKMVFKEYQTMIASPRVPSDEAVVQFLQRCGEVVKIALSKNYDTVFSLATNSDTNATSSLLDLDVEDRGNGTGTGTGTISAPQTLPKQSPKSSKTSNFQSRMATEISSLLNDLLRNPKIFISPEVLRYYTLLQAQLKEADHFPEIFSLYATKPVPNDNGSTITYHTPNPKTVKSAIPKELANIALDVAIEKKNLALCLAIIDESFCKPAFYRSKFFRKAALPLAGLATAPTAAYAAALYISTLQSAMDPNTALWLSFSAILAYVGFTSSIGMVAITTANDQMMRVVWIPGMPLRQRWLREEERAAMDKVAVAWGFKDPMRIGEEEGEEWESLREFLGMRGMILDKTDLMDGMDKGSTQHGIEEKQESENPMLEAKEYK